MTAATAQNTTVECVSSPGVGKNIKYCLSVGGQYSDPWCSDYVEGSKPPTNVHHSIEPGTGTTTVLIHKQTINATQGVAVTQGSKTGVLRIALDGSSVCCTTIEITSASDVYFDTLEDIVIATTPNSTTIAKTNVLDTNNGATSSYGLPTITNIVGKPYDEILSVSDGVTSTSGPLRVNTVQEVHLLEPRLTQDITITPTGTGPYSGSFKITYNGKTSSRCLDVRAFTTDDIETELQEVFKADGIENAASKIQSVVVEPPEPSGGASDGPNDGGYGSGSNDGSNDDFSDDFSDDPSGGGYGGGSSGGNNGRWVTVQLDQSFTGAKSIGVNQTGCTAMTGATLAANTASWGNNPWGVNNESGAYFTLTLPTGCDYCHDRRAATSGKIYPGKASGPHSLKYELEQLPTIGENMLTVVRTPSAVGEGYVWTITFSGLSVKGSIPTLSVAHGIEASDIVARSTTVRHRVEAASLSVGTEQKLSVRVTTTGRIGGLRARGGDTFDVVGTNFGPRGTVVVLFYGPSLDAQRYTAKTCDVIVDHTTEPKSESRMKCVSASGVGKDHVSLVEAGGQLSSTNLTSAKQEYSAVKIFYHPPSLVSVSGLGAAASTTSGGATIIITGSNFGPTFTTFTAPCTFETAPVSTQAQVAYTAAGVAAHYGQAPNSTVVVGVNYNAECCVVESDERMTCRTTQGTGFNHAWTIRVGGQWSTVNKAGTSYGQPIIVSYDNFPSQLVPNVNDFNTTGGEPVVIVGKNLGHLLWKVQTVSYGMMSDEEFELDTSTCVLQTPHTELRCLMAPGAGLQMKWKIVVDAQSSVYPTSAYGPPEITGFSMDPTSVLRSSVSELNSHGGQKISKRSLLVLLLLL